MQDQGSIPGVIVVLGHTAGGKTKFAAHLAKRIDGEIISADSRQVYRGMDIGTGKDLDDYRVDGTIIPYHLIDIVDAGQKYSLFDFQRDAGSALKEVLARKHQPILCGGSGLYLESIIRQYQLIAVPPDPLLRSMLEAKSDAELRSILEELVPLHNTTDTTHRKRMIRAIEIAKKSGSIVKKEIEQHYHFTIFGIRYEVEERRKRITERLRSRLASGMVEEVKRLLQIVPAADLEYYGLEYKFLTEFCLGKTSREEMFNRLNIAIHQFAKRQMTWFRGMERRGIKIDWIDGELPLSEKLDKALEVLTTNEV